MIGVSAVFFYFNKIIKWSFKIIPHFEMFKEDFPIIFKNQTCLFVVLIGEYFVGFHVLNITSFIKTTD